MLHVDGKKAMQTLLVVFFWIFLVFYIFLKLTDKYVNPYKLIMIFGKKGSGKTTFLTKVAMKNIKKNRVVYSTIDIPGTRLFKVESIGDFTFEPYSIVLIDEVGMIWDNRDFKKFRPEVRDFFKFQRQYKLTVYLFSQTFDIDLKLRNLTDRMYLLQNVARVFSVARRIDKRITISHGDGDKPSSLVDDYSFAPILAPSSYIFTFIPRWIVYFKSYDPKKLPLISYRQLNLSSSQEKYLSTQYWIADSFHSFLSKTFERIRLFMVNSPHRLLIHRQALSEKVARLVESVKKK